jgi:hypothetical protein
MKPFWLGDKIWFTIPIAPEDRNHIQLILRRTYHASACENQKAQVELDGLVIGVWYCPGFNQRHHFAQDEFLLPHSLTREKTELKLVLRIQSTCWIESSVELLAVLQP